MILVKNVHGSGDDTPPSKYSSWKEYWEMIMRRSFSKCSNIACYNLASDGGHVTIVNGSNNWYLVPLCSKCNNPSHDHVFYVLHKDLLKLD